MPIGPAAGDQDVLADEREGEGGVDGVAERVEDRGDIEVHLRPVHPDVRGGQGHVLGEGAVAADAEADGAPAQMAAPGQTVAAAAADEMALAADEIADGDVPYGVAHRDHLADELVAEDARGGDRPARPAVPGADVQVGAADTGTEHLDQYVE